MMSTHQKADTGNHTPEAALNAIVSRLKGLKPDKKGGYLAFCPCHADGAKQGRRSLHVKELDQKILIHCFAGCETKAIIEALGMTMKDLFVDDKPQHPLENKSIIATYNYIDIDKKLSYQVIRYEPKDFRQRRPDPATPEKWIWNMKGIKPLLYRLPELQQALVNGETVFITEGEKDTDILVTLGLTATCNHGGAGKWTEVHSGYFPAGADVVILPDNDDPGRNHAQKVAHQLVSRGCKVRMVELPGIPDKGDVSDWLASGGKKEALLTLVTNAPLQKKGEVDNISGGYTAQGIMATDFPEPRWLVPGILCEGLSLLAGAPKLGKSWLCLTLAAAIAAGGCAFGTVKVDRAAILYLALEDNPRRLKKRLEIILQHGQAPDDFNIFTRWPRLDQGGLQQLDKWMLLHDNCKLIIIDTFGKVRGKTNNNSNAYLEDYKSMEGLKQLADRYGACVLLVHHLRKAGSDDPLEQISGTTGISGAADGIMILKRERGAANATLYITGRDVEEQELALSFNQTIGTWVILGEAAEYRMSQERRDILDVLRKTDQAIGPKEISELVGRKEGTIRKTVLALLRDGLINKASYGKYYISQQGFTNKENDLSGNTGNSSNTIHTVNSGNTTPKNQSVTECYPSVTGSVTEETQQRCGKSSSVTNATDVTVNKQNDTWENILESFAGQEVDLNDFPL